MPLDTTLFDLDSASTILEMRVFFKKARPVSGEEIGAEIAIFGRPRNDQLHPAHHRQSV